MNIQTSNETTLFPNNFLFVPLTTERSITINENQQPKRLSEQAYKKIKKTKIKQLNEECAICLNCFQKSEIIKKLPCKHKFHKDCIKKWLQQNHNCPFCRFDIEKHFKKQSKE